MRRCDVLEHTLAELVDVGRYPIDALEGSGAALVERCRRELEATALCCLPNFLTPFALDATRSEILAAEKHAYWIESERTSYSWRDNRQLGADHPQRMTSPHRLGSITRDKFPQNGVLNQLFERDEITEFVRRCLAVDLLYRVACPYLSMNVKVMKEGAQHAWHFDANDGAVSLLVQAARRGGRYEYVPYIRSDEDENYTQVVKVRQGADDAVITLDIKPGTFCLFKGNRSIHRVSPITRGEPDRLIALFAYDQNPNLHYNEHTLRTVLGRLPDGFQINRGEAGS